jgi:GNAT superfamily N-acetyltransferase
MTILRNATHEDLPKLLPLFEQLGYPCEIGELENRFEMFDKMDGYGVAVAEHDSEIASWIAWSKSILFVKPMSRFHIEGLVVDDKYRSQGIGKKLMKFVEDIASAHTPCIIDLTSGLRRAADGTHDFYKSLGYNNEGTMVNSRIN